MQWLILTVCGWVSIHQAVCDGHMFLNLFSMISCGSTIANNGRFYVSMSAKKFHSLLHPIGSLIFFDVVDQ
jgi:hypothetical protein